MGELGSWLIRAREARGLTLEDAERDTRISRRYLQALESEQFEVIPAPVYARGFLRSYSQYLGLDPVEMLALFPRDDEPAYSTASAASAAPARPSMQQPASAVGPARPSWRRPPATRVASAATRPQEQHWEPTIGIDIGVPVPTRKINADPAAQARSIAVALVAIVAVVAVVLIAWLISNLGGGGNSTPGPDLAPKSALTPAPGGAPAITTAEASSGLPVTPGVVPNVTGQPLEKARLAIQEAGYEVKERHEKSTDPKGTVSQQSPAPDLEYQAGLVVTIVVSDGP